MGNGGLSTFPAEWGFPCCNEIALLAPLQPGTHCKYLLLFGRAAARLSLPSTWDFSTPGADLCTSIELPEVSSGPVLKLSSVLLVEALPFGVSSYPPNLMSSANLLACSLYVLAQVTGEMLMDMGHKTDPCRAVLVAGCQRGVCH